ncbi:MULTISPECIES: POTRA domain-containing protein [Calditerrivibrio]|uniref:POTRA domain-containing protein n=1 Tax=Calditerrivibrio TaxID=545865 RepID=UPI003C72F0EE
MRVLSLVLIFSVIFATKLFSKEIKGEIPSDLKLRFEEYSSKLTSEKFTELLSFLGYYINYEDDNEIVVQKSKLIRSINFKGNFSILNSQLLLASGINIGDPFYIDTLYKIRKNIEAFYKNNGFIDAEIKVDGDGENIKIVVDEGLRYYIDEIEIVIDEDVKSIKIPIKPYTEETINKEVEKAKELLKNNYYFNSKVLRQDLIIKGIRRIYPLDDPIPLLITLIKGGVVIKPVIYISKGEQYKLNIKNDFDFDNMSIKKFFIDHFNTTDKFDIRELELKLTEYLEASGFINSEVDITIEDREIFIKIDADNYVRSFDINLFINNQKNSDLIDSNLKSLILSCQDDEAKKYLEDKLRSEGYEEFAIKDYNIIRSQNSVKGRIVVETKTPKTIKAIFVNGKRYETKKIYKLYPQDIDNLRKEIYQSYSNNCWITGLNVEKIENESIFFTLNCSTPHISGILSNTYEVVNKIKKRFFNDNDTLTTSKFEEIYDYLLRNKNSEKVSLQQFNIDNETILAINRLKGKENRIYGIFGYDSIDRFSLELGYNRFDILNSGRTLSLSVKKSYNETSLLLSLAGQKTIHKIVDDYLAINLKDRDENDFEFKEATPTAISKITLDNLQLYVGLSLSYLDIYKTSFSKYYADIYEKDYKILNVPLKLIYSSKDFESLSGDGYFISISETPIFTKDNTIVESRGKFEVLKLLPKSPFLLKLTAELQHLSGDKDKIPVNYLIVLGGPQRMKAYGYRELGFKDPITNATLGDKSLTYSQIFLGYKPIDFVVIGPFFEYALYGDDFNKMSIAKDLGLELIISQKGVGFFSMSYGYAPFSPHRGSNAFYMNFGVNF